ncbi:acyltransferase [Synechococcus sp. CBW1004]|nr:acyltransferase [Synechococcus sp. CBW1004]
MLEVHPTAMISSLADIEPSSRGSLISIGEDSVVDSFVKFKPAGGLGAVRIGSRCVINSGCVIYTGNGISIGDDVAIAANCTLAPVNHAFEDADELIRKQGFLPSRGGIRIGNDVWIGANCVLLDGAVLEDGVVVAAGSVVRSRLHAYGVYAGTPLRLIRQRVPRSRSTDGPAAGPQQPRL